jgi:hypothetical protein
MADAHNTQIFYLWRALPNEAPQPFCAAYAASRLYTILLSKIGSDRQVLGPLHALHSFSGRDLRPSTWCLPCRLTDPPL